MKEIVLIGSGGCMRELAWQIQEQNKEERTWKIKGYVDREKPQDDRGVLVGEERITYLGDDDYFAQHKEPVCAAICVGSPLLRKKIAEKLMKNAQIVFPNLILGETRLCPDLKIGKGCIISMGAKISTNVTMGDFVFLNMDATVCHDGTLGDFVTLSPGARLAGNVHVGAKSEIGMGTQVRQGIRIGQNVTTGAGSVIVKDIKDDLTVVGVPAGKIRG